MWLKFWSPYIHANFKLIQTKTCMLPCGFSRITNFVFTFFKKQIVTERQREKGQSVILFLDFVVLGCLLCWCFTYFWTGRNPRTGVLCESLVAVKGRKCLTNSEGDDRDTKMKKQRGKNQIQWWGDCMVH